LLQGRGSLAGGAPPETAAEEARRLLLAALHQESDDPQHPTAPAGGGSFQPELPSPLLGESWVPLDMAGSSLLEPHATGEAELPDEEGEEAAAPSRHASAVRALGCVALTGQLGPFDAAFEEAQWRCTARHHAKGPRDTSPTRQQQQQQQQQQATEKRGESSATVRRAEEGAWLAELHPHPALSRLSPKAKAEPGSNGGARAQTTPAGALERVSRLRASGALDDAGSSGNARKKPSLMELAYGSPVPASVASAVASAVASVATPGGSPGKSVLGSSLVGRAMDAFEESFTAVAQSPAGGLPAEARGRTAVDAMAEAAQAETHRLAACLFGQAAVSSPGAVGGTPRPDSSTAPTEEEEEEEEEEWSPESAKVMERARRDMERRRKANERGADALRKQLRGPPKALQLVHRKRQGGAGVLLQGEVESPQSNALVERRRLEIASIPRDLTGSPAQSFTTGPPSPLAQRSANDLDELGWTPEKADAAQEETDRLAASLFGSGSGGLGEEALGGEGKRSRGAEVEREDTDTSRREVRGQEPLEEPDEQGSPVLRMSSAEVLRISGGPGATRTRFGFTRPAAVR